MVIYSLLRPRQGRIILIVSRLFHMLFRKIQKIIPTTCFNRITQRRFDFEVPGRLLMFDIVDKTNAYNHICRVYDDHAGSLGLACRSGCATCCTINVAITALEGYLIVEALERAGRIDVLEPLVHHLSRQRFIPQFTFNRLTEMMVREEDLPEEVIDPAWGACPLLGDDRCPIYDVRPFACRCLVSLEKCRYGEYALMPPLTVAVNHVMLQYIEHVDSSGFTGNMIDVLLFMQSPENRARYRAGYLSVHGRPFIPNFPVRHLLIEPEYKEAMAPLLTALNRGGE